jgi:hypothetical protein
MMHLERNPREAAAGCLVAIVATVLALCVIGLVILAKTAG